MAAPRALVKAARNREHLPVDFRCFPIEEAMGDSIGKVPDGDSLLSSALDELEFSAGMQPDIDKVGVFMIISLTHASVRGGLWPCRLSNVNEKLNV